MESEVILVDLQDRVLGHLTKSEAHKNPRLHRAYSVFLYHDDRMLLQQRAFNKYHCGGLWANTCCSHPRPGEKILTSASERLWEECGIRFSGFRELFNFTYLAKFADDLYEYEYDHVLLGRYNGEFHENKEEVEMLKWVSISELQYMMLTNPLEFTPWFLICAQKVMECIRKRQLKRTYQKG